MSSSELTRASYGCERIELQWQAERAVALQSKLEHNPRIAIDDLCSFIDAYEHIVLRIHVYTFVFALLGTHTWNEGVTFSIACVRLRRSCWRVLSCRRGRWIAMGILHSAFCIASALPHLGLSFIVRDLIV